MPKIDRDGFYIAIVKTEEMRRTEPPIVVLSFINLQLAVRRRSRRFFACHQAALQDVRAEIAKEIPRDEMVKFARSLMSQCIVNRDDVAYINEFMEMFPRIPALREALRRAKRELRKVSGPVRP
jgi:hypothetical protein